MRVALLSLAAVLALAACNDDGSVQGNRVTISGPVDRVDPFVERQIARHPGVVVGNRTQSPGSNQVKVTLAIRPPADRNDATDINRRAMKERFEASYVLVD